MKLLTRTSCPALGVLLAIAMATTAGTAYAKGKHEHEHHDKHHDHDHHGTGKHGVQLKNAKDVNSDPHVFETTLVASEHKISRRGAIVPLFCST